MFRRLTFRQIFTLIICIILLQLLLLLLSTFLFNYSQYETISGHHSIIDIHDGCKIDDKQAISALNRVQTLDCRQKLIAAYCSIKFQPSWPSRLQNECHANSKLFTCMEFRSEFLNHFVDKKSNKILRIDPLQPFNHTDCTDLCMQIDFEFALFVSNQYCICTNNYQSIIDQTNHTECDLQCVKHSKCPSNFLFIISTGIKKIHHQLPPLITTDDHEQNFTRPKIVFLLLLSGRSTLQVNRLMLNIFDNHHYYLIHVDAHDNYLYAELKYLQRKYPANIRLTQQRFDTIWGGSSLLTAILSCIREALNEWNDWNFILNLSESSFPIKKIKQLERYLSLNRERNFIKSHGKNTFDFIQTQALNKVFVQCERRMWRIADRSLIKGIVWDGGSDWMILSQSFCRYVTNELNNRRSSLVHGLRNYFEFSLLPAESFFHIVLRNTAFCTTIISNNLLATNWNRKRGCKCQQKKIVDWCGCSPNIFRLRSPTNSRGDIQRLMATEKKPLFFGRKFSPLIDGQVIDFVELRFLNQNFRLNNLGKNYDLYLENSYHSRFDLPNHLPWFRRNFFTFFACQLLDSLCSNIYNNQCEIEIIETNLLFDNSNGFYGTIVRFQESIQNYKIEMILRSFSNQTIIFDSSSVPRLKSLKVYEYFRNTDCVLESNQPLEVWHEWQPFFGVYHILFIFIDPWNRIANENRILLNNTKITDNDRIGILYRHNNQTYYPIMNGLWKLLIMNEATDSVIGMGRFFILPTDTNDNDDINMVRLNHSTTNKQSVTFIMGKYSEFFPQNGIHLSMINKIWYIHQYCFHHHNGDHLCKNFNTTIYHHNNCDQVDWNVDKLKALYSF
ncbi:xylosyltransferase oxt [Dermatophagoides farinae]|uniref:protein xylosyltransferase n=1 Tax=Dermatophagoides farinae TaxID=6954 RepID=A0A9D4NS33_DERFA|nr:xylosyltransferase oxt [Dermatophagoides farinae]